MVAEIDAKMGGYGLVPPELDGAIVSSHYFIYSIDETKLNPRFLEWFLRCGLPEILIQPYVKGSTNYASIRQQHFPLLEMRLPNIDLQNQFVDQLELLSTKAEELVSAANLLHGELDALIPATLISAFNHESHSKNRRVRSPERGKT